MASGAEQGPLLVLAALTRGLPLAPVRRSAVVLTALVVRMCREVLVRIVYRSVAADFGGRPGRTGAVDTMVSVLALAVAAVRRSLVE